VTNLNHEIFLFNRQDSPVKRLSKAASVDLYRNGKYIDGVYFPVSWTNAKKTKVIEKLIAEDIKKERLKTLKKQNTRKYRQEIYSLPFDWDIKLLNSKGKVIGFNQLSKAKGFKLFQQDPNTKRFKLKSTWELPRISDSVSIKKEMIVDAYEKEILKTPLPLEIDIEEALDDIREAREEELEAIERGLPEYESWITKSDDFKAFNKFLGFAKYRKIRFTEDYPLEVIMGNLSPRQEQELKEIFENEWKKEWRRSQNSSFRFNMKMAINYYDQNGDLMTYVDEKTGEIKPLAKWMNTPRMTVRDPKDGVELMDSLISTMEKSFNEYINSVDGTIGVIGQMEIETLYLY